MIIDVNGDMLKLAPQGSLIGIPVNTVGIAGKGLARYMKLRWPESLKIYVKACKKGVIATGDLVVTTEERYRIAMLPTKYHWKNPSDTNLIEITLVRLLRYMEDNDIKLCHIPRLGCGKNTGMLDYENTVRPIVERVFGGKPNSLLIYNF